MKPLTPRSFLIVFIISSTASAQTNFCLHFDGTDDYVVKSPNAFGSQLTFQCWIKPDNDLFLDYPDAGAAIFAQGATPNATWADFAVGISRIGQTPALAVELGNPSQGLQHIFTPITLGIWTHITVVFNSGLMKVYLNGVLSGTHTYPITLLHFNNTPAYFGSRYSTSRQYDRTPFKGHIEDIVLWSVALSEPTILQHYACPPNLNSIGLLGYWAFNEGSGLIANDLTSNNNDGTLFNGVEWVDALPDVPVLVRAKAFLQGPYVSTAQLMHDSLRTKNLIPLSEPYTGLPNFTHTGGGGGEQTTPAVLAITGSDAIVDWVFLELRGAANPAQALATRSALLQRDGDIVDVDGVSPVAFGIPGGQSYSLAVRHRNHLGVQLGAPTPYPACGTITKDFQTTPPEGFYAFNGLNPAEKTINSTLALWAGNGQVDYLLKYNGSANDRNAILSTVGLTTPNAIVPGYLLADYNLDGQVKYNGSVNDRNVLLGNVGITTPSAILYDQIGH